MILAIDPVLPLLARVTKLKLISKLQGRSMRLRISMYANDGLVFLNPNKAYIQVIGLCTNIQTSQVATIRCVDIDLDDVLEETLVR